MGACSWTSFCPAFASSGLCRWYTYNQGSCFSVGRLSWYLHWAGGSRAWSCSWVDSPLASKVWAPPPYHGVFLWTGTFTGFPLLHLVRTAISRRLLALHVPSLLSNGLKLVCTLQNEEGRHSCPPCTSSQRQCLGRCLSLRKMDKESAVCLSPGSWCPLGEWNLAGKVQGQFSKAGGKM